VKFCIASRCAWCAVAVCLLLGFAAAGVHAKPIRLRNQTIHTERAEAAKMAAAQAPAKGALSGLYLVQFYTSPGPVQRAVLSAAGVHLLHYVPEDTFIARFRNEQQNQVRALPFVEWVGEYGPQFKVHEAVRAKAQGKAGAAGSAVQPIGVTVLLAQGASPAEVAGVRSSLTKVQQQSTIRSGTILRGTLNPARLDALARSQAVLWIEPAPQFKLVDEVASKIVAGDGGTHTLLTQSLGYDGSGVSVAVADSGLNNGDAETMHPDLFGRTPRFFYYGALEDAADEHSHGTHVAGIVAGSGATGEVDENGELYGLGVAPGASIIAQRIFDGVGNYEPPADGFSELTKDATGAGAVIGSNSWGDDTQGRYDVSAMEFDELVRDCTGTGTNDRPYILEFSAGNAGPGTQTIGSPAVAKNVIATGASENDRPDLFIYSDGPDAMADFSSRGPCEDGRIKPDIVAPGTWISSLQSASATDEYAWLPIDGFYQYQGGTSQAGPHASGAAAVFVQYYREQHANETPSPALVKAALINSAYDMDDSFGTGPVPNMDEGWGLLDLTPIFDSTLSYQFFDQPIQLTNGQVFEYQLLLADPSEPLMITLAYTDVPGFPGSLPALVNDLDLEVIAPDGQMYRGNQFKNGESIPNPAVADTINNVEEVHLASPVPGEYTVRVRARNVVEDILDRPGAPRQDFALVISSLAAEPGVGLLHLDRGSYTAPGQIKVTLIDTDLAGEGSASVRVSSSTEPTPETLVVTAASSGGWFTGTVDTVTGPAAPDGRLQIANGDLIQIAYFDASVGRDTVATARADLVPPVLTTPTATGSFGREVVSWSSDEPATSMVCYGTNAVLSDLTLAVSDLSLSTDHSSSLGGLIPGATYYYYVVSTDEAGNTTTNDAGGALFTFNAPIVPTILVVDSYGVDPISDQVPPLDPWTDPLRSLGVSYEVWDASLLGEPTNALQGYRAVIWRVPELMGAWSAPERVAISNYLHSGGALFVASMQLMSRLELDVQDTDFIHNVLQVESYTPDPDSTGAAQIIGTSNETIGNGLDIALDYTIYEDRWSILGWPIVDPADISETMIPNTNSTAVLRNDFGDIVGLRWPAVGQQAPGRLVFLSFPLDAVPAGDGVNDRLNLMRNVVSFLVPGAAGLATVSLDSPAYTLPSVVTVDAADSQLAGQGTLTVTASTTTDTNGMPVSLHETTTRGEFVGTFLLVPTSTPSEPGKLPAQNGDSLRVDYFSSAANHLVSAGASVDTVPPEISGVGAEPDYENALVYWDTSEPADALVQYGESPLLGRTAYQANPTTSHELDLAGLSSDRLYYYKVVSRDLAGNVVVDDNGGNLYTFRTLLPISAPWSDSMDDGATDWSVYSDPYSQCEWTLGIPNNGVETSAHSPPNAWGSNLGGGVIDAASTFLISPAIKLPAGARATLRFWHSYDFSTWSDMDIYEDGQLLLVTNNNATTYITLADYADDFSGWTEETFDLTPYAGGLIYLIWDYEMFSFDTRPRGGWLVDDVSISVSTPGAGTILISNNLWQATTVLNGPLTLTNTGMFTGVSNAPPGQYTVSFEPVPYYSPVLPQTNTLTAGGTLVFTGTYSFPDVNHNGISDLWEQTFFGNVSAYRTGSTDTDGDGMTDHAEFMAGTDPNSPPPQFRVSARKAGNGTLQLEWPSAPGQQYLILTSGNLASWSAYGDWIEATGTVSTLDVPIPAGGTPGFFKVQAGATNGPAGLPPDLHLTIQHLSGGSMQISWPTVSGRGYCFESSTDALSWSPVWDWMRAGSTAIMNYPLAAPAPGSPRLYRVRVSP